MTGILVACAVFAGALLGWKAAASIAALGMLWLAVDRRLPYAMPVGLVVAAAAIGAIRSEPPTAVEAPHWLDAADAIRGRVVAGPVLNGQVQQFVIDVAQRHWHGAWSAADGGVCVAARPYPPLSLNDETWVGGKIERIDDQAASIQNWMTSRGGGGSLFAYAVARDAPGDGPLRALAMLRREIASALQDAAPGDAGVLLSGFVTGDDRALTDARQDAFLRTSTVHLTAVSGANLALLVALLA